MPPIVHGTALLPLLRFPRGAAFSLRVVMDEAVDLAEHTATFAVRSRFGQSRPIFIATESGGDAFTKVGQAITLTLAPDAADETEGSSLTFAALAMDGENAYRLDFRDTEDALALRLQGDIEWLPEEGAWEDEPTSIITLPEVTVSIVAGAISVTVSLITSGGSTIADIEGLQAALDAKATVTALNSLSSSTNSALATKASTEALSALDTATTNALAGKQASDATLTALAALVTAANKLIYATGEDAFSTTDFTEAGRTFLAAVSAGAQRAAIGAYGEGDNPTFGTGSFSSLEVGDAVLLSNMTDVWDNVATTYAGLRLNITDTASHANSRLFDFQIGGATRFHLTKAQLFIGTGTSDTSRLQFGGGGSFASQYNAFWFNSPTGNAGMYLLGNSEGLTGGSCRIAGVNSGTLTMVAGNAIFTLGATHATTPTAQVIAGHTVTTGTGASVEIRGGNGSAARGNVLLNGGNRSAYIASPSLTQIRDILIAHGLMAAS